MLLFESEAVRACWAYAESDSCSLPDVHVSRSVDRGALGDIDCVIVALYSDHTSAEWEYAVVRQMQSVPLGSQFWLSEKNHMFVDPLKIPKGQVILY